MPQPSIPLEPGQMYHIWTHANGDENLFREDENYTYFLEKYSYYIPPVADTFAYCLMPNHLHLMVRVKGEKDLVDIKDLTGFQNLSGLVSKQFSNLFNAYSKAFNKLYERRGALFERQFKRKLIDSDNYFGTLIAYIHNNPVHHEFARTPDEWTYSSWGAYLHDKPTKIRKDEGLDWFGGRDELIRVHKEINMEKLKSVFEE
jgi:putative transposase